jgi:hypothetical protein
LLALRLSPVVTAPPAGTAASITPVWWGAEPGVLIGVLDTPVVPGRTNRSGSNPAGSLGVVLKQETVHPDLAEQPLGQPGEVHI